MSEKKASSMVENDPLGEFSQCHEGIFRKLLTLEEFSAIFPAIARARQIAEEIVPFFNGVVLDHHTEEEQDLFPLVLKNAQAGEERDTVQKLIDKLTSEHRAIEAIWRTVEPKLASLNNGKIKDAEVVDIPRLVQLYQAHAKFEEAVFLPLSAEILRRTSSELASLGLSLHTRHVFRAARQGFRGS